MGWSPRLRRTLFHSNRADSLFIGFLFWASLRCAEIVSLHDETFAL